MTLRADLNLLKFSTYSEYIESYTKIEEYRYLRSMKVIKSLVKLGYRTNAIIYEEKEFERNRAYVLDLLLPKTIITQLFSTHLVGNDPALVAFAEREERNMQKKLSIRQRSGFDISGYIDFADSLRRCSQHIMGATNWKAVFQGRTLLSPNRSHLSFYDWHTGLVTFNNSDNFDIMHHGAALMFKHTGDHKIIPVTTRESPHKDNVKRTFIYSPLYGCVVVYDHVVRKAS